MSGSQDDRSGLTPGASEQDVWVGVESWDVPSEELLDSLRESGRAPAPQPCPQHADVAGATPTKDREPSEGPLEPTRGLVSIGKDTPEVHTHPLRRTEPAIAFAIQPSAPARPQASAPLQEQLAAITDRVRELQLRGADLPSPRRPAPIELPERYQWLAALGEGGQGTVELVLDRDLGRPVALKTLHAHKVEQRRLDEFYREVRITGQLEHPHIIPVYDAGQLPDGRIYYTMRRMPGENLHNVLVRVRRGEPDVLRRWSLPALVQVLVKACHGVGYAHERGVVHRDIKPANILLGGHGEVLVVDWGIARVLEADRDRPIGQLRLWSEPGEERHERVRGSPPYMAPEQIQHPDQVTAAADVFCLGVLLYEMLTRQSPFQGSSVDDVVAALCHEKPVPPRERAPEFSIPAELEEICLRCLEKFPGHRYPTATPLAFALEEFLAGGRRRESAGRRIREALSMRSRHRVLLGRRAEAEDKLARERGPVGIREAARGKQPLRELRDRVDSLRRAGDGVFSEAVWALHQALSDDPDSSQARSLLGELYADRYAEAERLGAHRELAFFRALLRQFDDGRWGRWLRTGADLWVETVPAAARVQLHRLVEVDLRLVPGELIEPKPDGSWSLAPGRYAIAPSRQGAPEAEPWEHPSGGHPRWHYPLLLHRDERHRLRLDLRGEAEAGGSFCFIPGGAATVGGDPEAPGAGASRQVQHPPYALARHPVTVGAYARFLEWIAEDDPTLARAHTPPSFGPMRQAGERRPVRDLRATDAEAYCRWMSEATGIVVRLPSADEWEVAARGADRRAFPWGDRFDPELCASLWGGDPAGPPPEVGTHPVDCSPFGVEDTAGNVWEWTASQCEGDRRLVLGGSMLSEEPGCRIAARRSLPIETRLRCLGFRVLRELPR